MDYAALRTELLQDPFALGYKLNAGPGNNTYVAGTATDAQAAALLNALTTGRTLPRTAVPATQILGAVVSAEWPAAGTVAESKLRAILGMATLDASNTNIRGLFADIFGAATTSRANLLALGTYAVSRATELGWGLVTEGDVTLARTKGGSW